MSLTPRSALRRLINFGYLPSLRLSYSSSSRWKPSVCSIHLPFLPRRLHYSSPDTPIPDIPERICPKLDPTSLPLSCPGCGAFTQWVTPEEAGYYSVNRKSVKEYIRRFSSDSEKSPSEAEGVQNRNSNVHGVDNAPAEIKLGVESAPQPEGTWSPRV